MTYVDPEEVRAVLGVSDEELSDDTVSLPLYGRMLSMDLEDLHPGLEQLCSGISAQATVTAQEQKLLDVVAVFSVYATSKTLLTSASLFAPKRITDGRAEMERITDPFQGVRDGVSETLITLQNRVLTLVAALGNTVAVTKSRSYFAAAGLATDPITNT